MKHLGEQSGTVCTVAVFKSCEFPAPNVFNVLSVLTRRCLQVYPDLSHLTHFKDEIYIYITYRYIYKVRTLFPVVQSFAGNKSPDLLLYGCFCTYFCVHRLGRTACNKNRMITKRYGMFGLLPSEMSSYTASKMCLFSLAHNTIISS